LDLISIKNSGVILHTLFQQGSCNITIGVMLHMIAGMKKGAGKPAPFSKELAKD
jgi:quinol-cytochrome oxidoreductase complex cytochrome b subunit